MKKLYLLLIILLLPCLASCAAASLKELPPAEEKAFAYSLPANYQFNKRTDLGRVCYFGSDEIDYFLIENYTGSTGNQVPDKTWIYAVKDETKSLIKLYSKENGDGFDSDIIDFKANSRGLYWTTHAGRAFVNFYDAKTGAISEIASGYEPDGFGCDNLAVNDEYLLYTHGSTYYCHNLATNKIVSVPYVEEKSSYPVTELYGNSFPIREKRRDKLFISIISCETGKKIGSWDITEIGVENVTELGMEKVAEIVATEKYAIINSKYCNYKELAIKSKIFLIDLKQNTYNQIFELGEFLNIYPVSDGNFIFSDRHSEQEYIFNAEENVYCKLD